MSDTSNKLKNLPICERPRERLLQKGVSSLSGVELLALVLERGFPGESVLDISINMLGKFGDLNSMRSASIEDLLSIEGIGIAKACQISAVFEIARRVSGGVQLKSQEYTKSDDVYRLIKPYLISRQKEHFMVICLDSRRKLLGIDNISIGTVNQSLVHPREVFKSAISKSASYIILAHNHPSGDVSPSIDDISTTDA